MDPSQAWTTSATFGIWPRLRGAGFWNSPPKCKSDWSMKLGDGEPMGTCLWLIGCDGELKMMATWRSATWCQSMKVWGWDAMWVCVCVSVFSTWFCWFRMIVSGKFGDAYFQKPNWIWSYPMLAPIVGSGIRESRSTIQRTYSGFWTLGRAFWNHQHQHLQMLFFMRFVQSQHKGDTIRDTMGMTETGRLRSSMIHLFQIHSILQRTDIWCSKFVQQISAIHCKGIPSGKLTKLWKITIFHGKIHYKWSLSMAL